MRGLLQGKRGQGIATHKKQTDASDLISRCRSIPGTPRITIKHPMYRSLVLTALVCSSCSAWVFDGYQSAILKKLSEGASAAALASAVLLGGGPDVAGAVDFGGSYSDPNHPGCARLVAVEDDGVALVSGADGNPGCSGGDGRPWQLKGKVSGDDKIFIDFSPKGGPKDLTGVWEAGKKPGIRFPDGNKWTLEAKP